MPPFYQTLSDAGVRCAVVDFPVAHPLANFNGIHVIDWGTEFKLWRFETQPRRLAAQLVATYGRHPLTDYPGTKLDLDVALQGKLKTGIRIKQQLTVICSGGASTSLYSSTFPSCTRRATSSGDFMTRGIRNTPRRSRS